MSVVAALTKSTSGFSLGLGLVILYLAFVVVSIVGTVKIISKAGYSGWWVLIGLVPLVNFIMFLVFAFGQWPVLREAENIRSARQPSMPGWTDSPNRPMPSPGAIQNDPVFPARLPDSGPKLIPNSLFCTSCNQSLELGTQFCYRCGSAVTPPPGSTP